jgi:hypothetical protein
MPGGDGTGPLGFGPMTGRSAGFCAGYSTPGYTNPIALRVEFFGRGRGHRNWYYATGLPRRARFNQGFYAWDSSIPYSDPRTNIAPEQEMEILKNQSKYMEENIEAINERIKELEKSLKEKKD